MNSLSLFIYNIVIRLFAVIVAVASLFNKRAKRWYEGRKQQLPLIPEKNGKRIWFHCASLGEFEQARPVMERWRKIHPEDVILLSFFSPSGYEVRKNYSGADAVVYLPLDTERHAASFLDWGKPDMALFVKYEFWYHHLHQLHQRNIPVILFSALFRPQQVFFRWYGGLFVNMLQGYSKILVQNQLSGELLKSIGIESEVAYDTRFDRVAQVAADRKNFPVVESFKRNKKLLIAGSTWPKDEALLIHLIKMKMAPGYKFLIAPHDISPERLEALQKHIPCSSARLSKSNELNAAQPDVMIVDTMGQLSSLYAYADVAYIGGGFDVSVHNVLEAAVYGIPVMFGKNYQKSWEAIELLKGGGAFCVPDEKAIQVVLKQCEQQAFESNRKYVMHRTGGTEKVLRAMELQISPKKTA